MGNLVLAPPVDLVVRWLRSVRTRSLVLSTLGIGIELRHPNCCCFRSLLGVVYGALRVDRAPTDLRFAITRAHDRLRLEIEREPSFVAADEDDMMDMLDQALVIQLQRERRDLFFAHSAVLELGGRAVLLVAPSGVGKSTTAWALSHYGFRYVSDELAPIELATLRVHPFLRAPRLKAEPPAGFPLPSSAKRTDRMIHVPIDSLPGGVYDDPLPIGAVIFLHRAIDAITTWIRPASTAEATAHLLANALNPLAHHGDGLDAAVAIAEGVPCFSLGVSDLRSACRLLRTTVEGLGRIAA